MARIALQTIPPGISTEMLVGLLNEARERESVLRAIIKRFEQHYGGGLEDLESRLG